MIELFIGSLLFFLPAGISNVTPVLINKLPLFKDWNTPMDFGKTFRGKRIFGNNKRWRGLVNGALMGAFSSVLLYISFGPLLPYSSLSQALWAGFALGAGALLGDAIESFFKRQLNIKSGDSWFPFDQTDYIIGGLVFASFVVPLSMALVAMVFTQYFLIHLLASYIGYLLELKEKPI